MRWHGTIKQEHQRLLNCRLSSCPPCRACPSYRRKCMQTIPNIKSMSPYFRKKKSLAPTPLLSFVKEEKDVFFFLPSFLCELEGASIIGKENTRRKQKTCGFDRWTTVPCSLLALLPFPAFDTNAHTCSVGKCDKRTTRMGVLFSFVQH